MKDLTKKEFNALLIEIKSRETDSLSTEDIAAMAKIKKSRLDNILYGKVKNSRDEVRKLANTFTYLRDMIPDTFFYATEEEVTATQKEIEMLNEIIKSKDDQINNLKLVIEIKDKYEKGLEGFNDSLVQIIKHQENMEKILVNFTKSYKAS